MGLGLFLAFFLIYHVPPLSVSAEGDGKSATCPKNNYCGDLAGHTLTSFDSSHPSDCGFCMLDCKNGIAFEYPPEKWFSFNADENIGDTGIKLQDNELEPLLRDRRCKSFLHNISFPNSPFISYSIVPNITLYRCTGDQDKRQMQAYESRNHSKCDDFTVYYQHPGEPRGQEDSEGAIQINCTVVTLPMVPEAYLGQYLELDLFELLTADFHLEWRLSEHCKSCRNGGPMCRTDWSQLWHSLCAKEGKNKKLVILCTAASAGSLAIFVILAYFFPRKYSFLRIWIERGKLQNVEDFLKNYGSLAPKRYHYSEVKKMTNSFKIKLGQGGYGCVYKGKLQDGSPVAVKVLKESKGSGEEFINEVASISRTSHVNIVTLLGFCFQGRKRALVYEFMPNGSLEKFIYGGNSLTNRQLEWKTLYNIAVGIARGLEYLHRGCNTRILHFDIKPHNILLDENFCPKISDFGLAKLCLQKESIVSTLDARGTVGYIAPEFFCRNIGRVSHKSDVYSYGMLVFEIAGGRKNIDAGVDHSSELYFPHWIYARLDRGEELGLYGISNEEENDVARKMIIVSLWCIQTDPLNRPSMSKVVEMLEGNLQALEFPPKPFLSSPARASQDSSTVYPSTIAS